MAETDIIKDMSLDLLELRQTEEELIRTMQDIKTTCILEVEAEWETTKDKTLSNATKRGVEVDLRLSSDAEYMTALENQEELHQTIRRDQIELEFQQREFQRQSGNASTTLALDRIVGTLKGIDETIALGFVAEKVAEMDAQMME